MRAIKDRVRCRPLIVGDKDLVELRALLSTEVVIGQSKYPLVLELDLVFETITEVSQGLDAICQAFVKRADPVTCIQHGGHLTKT